LGGGRRRLLLKNDETRTDPPIKKAIAKEEAEEEEDEDEEEEEEEEETGIPFSFSVHSLLPCLRLPFSLPTTTCGCLVSFLIFFFKFVGLADTIDKTHLNSS